MALLRCPKCRNRALDPVDQNAAEVDACSRCGGLWFDGGELRRVVGPGLATMPPRSRALERDGTTTDLACPRCRVNPEYFAEGRSHELLVEVKVGGDRGVMVDTCGLCHGVWLDHGELQAIEAIRTAKGAELEIAKERTWGHWLFQLATSLPVEFNFQPRRRPVVTLILIALNVLVFVLQWTLGGSTDLSSRFGLVPAHAGEASWFLSLITHAFLHADPIHLLGNMYFLWILGDNLEDVLGRLGYLGLYALSALSCALAVQLVGMEPEIPRIGASGAVSGLLGAYAILFRRAELTFMLFVFQYKLKAWMYIGIWAVFNVVGFLFGDEGVAWDGHLGGFACGLAVAALSYKALLRRDPLLRLLNGVRTPAPGTV